MIISPYLFGFINKIKFFVTLDLLFEKVTIAFFLVTIFSRDATVESAIKILRMNGQWHSLKLLCFTFLLLLPTSVLSSCTLLGPGSPSTNLSNLRLCWLAIHLMKNWWRMLRGSLMRKGLNTFFYCYPEHRVNPFFFFFFFYC